MLRASHFWRFDDSGVVDSARINPAARSGTPWSCPSGTSAPSRARRQRCASISPVKGKSAEEPGSPCVRRDHATVSVPALRGVRCRDGAAAERPRLRRVRLYIVRRTGPYTWLPLIPPHLKHFPFVLEEHHRDWQAATHCRPWAHRRYQRRSRRIGHGQLIFKKLIPRHFSGLPPAKYPCLPRQFVATVTAALAPVLCTTRDSRSCCLGGQGRAPGAERLLLFSNSAMPLRFVGTCPLHGLAPCLILAQCRWQESCLPAGCRSLQPQPFLFPCGKPRPEIRCGSSVCFFGCVNPDLNLAELRRAVSPSSHAGRFLVHAKSFWKVIVASVPVFRARSYTPSLASTPGQSVVPTAPGHLAALESSTLINFAVFTTVVHIIFVKRVRAQRLVNVVS